MVVLVVVVVVMVVVVFPRSVLGTFSVLVDQRAW